MPALYFRLKPKHSRSHDRRHRCPGDVAFYCGDQSEDSDSEDDSVDRVAQDTECREYVRYISVKNAQSSSGLFRNHAQEIDNGEEPIISEFNSGSNTQYIVSAPNPLIAYRPNTSATSYSSADYVAQDLGFHRLPSIVPGGERHPTSMEYFDETGYGGYGDGGGAKTGSKWSSTSHKRKEWKSRDEVGRRVYYAYSFLERRRQSRRRDGTLPEASYESGNDGVYKGASLEEEINRWKMHYNRGVRRGSYIPANNVLTAY